MRPARASILLLLLLVLLLPACAVNPVSGRQELMLVSESEEIRMGQLWYPDAIWGAEGGGGEYYNDSGLKTYLKGVILDIHKVSHRPNLPVDFAIQNSSVPNAWAIPGHVVITRGLLAGLDSEAEFAFVMGHEMGHVSARHSAKQMSYGILRNVGLAAAGVALGGSPYADAAMTAGMVGSNLILLKYSREDELEADSLGMRYMAKLGYDPDQAIKAHESLEKVSDEYLKSIGSEPHERTFFEDLLSTHPRTSVRIEDLKKMESTLGPRKVKGDGIERKRFLEMTAGLRKVSAVYTAYYDPATKRFRDKEYKEAATLLDQAVRKAPDQPPFYAMQGFVSLAQKDYEKAQKGFSASLRLDNSYEPALRGMGALSYREGKYTEAIGHLTRAVKIFPGDIASNFFLGMSYFQTKAYSKALGPLRGYAAALPEDPEVHGLLGICLENTGDVRSAYNEYLIQLKVAPDNKMGRFAAERVKALRE